MNHHTTHQGDKVIPTAHIAKPASTPKTGRFASLGAPHRAPGSGAPSRGPIAAPFVARSLVVLCALAGIFALSVGVAGAAVPKLSSNGSFHSAGGSGVAVDQSSGDVFVTGFIGLKKTGGNEVEEVGISNKFDASGNLLSPPSPFAEGLNYGAAVNPTNGRLYVASPFAQIEIDDPNTGAQLSTFGVPGFFSSFAELFSTDVQIATDSAGDVYVPNVPESKVFKYSETGTLLETFAGSGAHALKWPTGVAVDSSGNVWVADDGNDRIEEFSATGAFLREFESEGVRALALDGHGDVLAIVNNSAAQCGAVSPPCEHLVEYSESGAQLTDIGAGYFGSSSVKNVNESTVAVDGASGRVYVTDGLKNVVWMYRPPLPPVLGQESAAEVGTSEAKLGAIVQPGGIQTTYRFEYDTREYHAGEGPHGASVPLPEGSAGEGFSARVVWASAKGLTPGVTYHYRVVVTNGLGTSTGRDQTFTTETPAQATCPNEPGRSGFSAALSDCRAYELVTPPGKNSAQPDTQAGESINIGGEDVSLRYGGYAGNHAADAGDRFAYDATEIMPGSQSAGLEFIAKRGANGWSSEDALPLRPYTGNRCPYSTASQTTVLKYSPNLEKAIIADNVTNGGFAHEFSESCRGEVVDVVAGEPFEENLLMRDNEAATYQLVDLTPDGVSPEPARLVMASADLNLVVFSEQAKLTPEATAGTINLYEWNEGTLRLLKLELPSGAPVAGTVVGISADGADLAFTANGNLYMRVDGDRTVQLDEARGGGGPGGGGAFTAFAADGSQVFFTDDGAAGLTGDTVAASGTNLYSYDLHTGELADLTPVSDAKAALLAVSEDGTYVYFRSEGVQSGGQVNQFGEVAQAGRSNVYLDHNGAVTFVMGNAITSQPIRISANGAYMAFSSAESLTGYNNEGQSEIYLYATAAGRFACVSCIPSGEAPTAGGTLLGPEWMHIVSDNGQVFFESAEALLPRDTNGKRDAYEYDYAEGAVHLISTGSSSSESVLLDASVSGSDVFFLTRQNLVPQDSFQEANHIYDARVDGGFPETAVPPACTTADACRAAATPQPGIYGAPASATFSGVGNLAPPPAVVKPKPKTAKCKKGDVKNSKGKCVREKHKKSKNAKKASNKGRA
jgi:hypothetical protein